MTMATFTPKKIHLPTAVTFAVGAMIGGGVFVLSGLALQKTGPSALLSFVLAGVAVTLSALSFAVIASDSPPSSSGYSYVGSVMGSPFWSFLTSWCFYLSGIIAAAFVLNAFGTYMQTFVTQGISSLVWAFIGAIALTLVNLGPASEIGKLEGLLVSGKLIVLLVLVVFGLAHFSPSSLHPFVPHGSGAMFATSAMLFIAYLGFNVITSISPDIDKPSKTVPRAIMLSMLVVAVVYVGVVVALLAAHISNYSEASVGIAARTLVGPVGGWLVVIGALVSTLSSANANILGSSEIMVRLAADKQVPTALGQLKHGHPYMSVALGAVLYLILIGTGQIGVIVGLANVTAIVALVIVNVAAAKVSMSDHVIGLRLPFGWALPALGSIGAVVLFGFTPVSTILLGLALVLAGVAIYALRGKLHRPRAHQELAAAVRMGKGPLRRVLSR